jgi:hypothetical protein
MLCLLVSLMMDFPFLNYFLPLSLDFLFFYHILLPGIVCTVFFYLNILVKVCERDSLRPQPGGPAACGRSSGLGLHQCKLL